MNLVRSASPQHRRIPLEPTSGAAAALRVVVVAPTRVYREGLERALADEPRLHLVGAVADVEAGVALARTASLDSLLIDLEADGTAAVRRLVTAAPDVRIVALAVDERSAETLALAEAGVAGYITRDDSLDELLATVLSVARDE